MPYGCRICKAAATLMWLDWLAFGASVGLRVLQAAETAQAACGGIVGAFLFSDSTH